MIHECPISSSQHCSACFFWSKDSGANSKHVQDELHHIQQIAGNKGAFAALRMDGHVVTWGDPEYGGDSSYLDDLQNAGNWGSQTSETLPKPKIRILKKNKGAKSKSLSFLLWLPDFDLRYSL